MNPHLHVSFSRVLRSWSTTWVVLLSLPILLAQAQEALKYTAEEYKAYQAIAEEVVPFKKIELAIAFLKNRPQSTLRRHAIAAYQAGMQEIQGNSKWKELIAGGESYLSLVPDDIFTVSMLATGYQQTKNHAKFVIYGEKVFESDPTKGNTAYYIAKAYQELKDDAKFVHWAEKTVELIPNNHELLLKLTKKYAAAKNNSKSVKYARASIKAMRATTKPEGVSDKTWNGYTTHLYATCFAVIGNVAFERQNYKGAVSNLEASLKYYKKNDLAYYYLAQSYWQQGRIDLAMKSFAKAYLLKGTTSRPAKQHLDNLYKSGHQNSLAGLERVIAKAQAELE